MSSLPHLCIVHSALISGKQWKPSCELGDPFFSRKVAFQKGWPLVGVEINIYLF